VDCLSFGQIIDFSPLEKGEFRPKGVSLSPRRPVPPSFQIKSTLVPVPQIPFPRFFRRSKCSLLFPSEQNLPLSSFLDSNIICPSPPPKLLNSWFSFSSRRLSLFSVLRTQTDVPPPPRRIELLIHPPLPFRGFMQQTFPARTLMQRTIGAPLFRLYLELFLGAKMYGLLLPPTRWYSEASVESFFFAAPFQVPFSLAQTTPLSFFCNFHTHREVKLLSFSFPLAFGGTFFSLSSKNDLFPFFPTTPLFHEGSNSSAS